MELMRLTKDNLLNLSWDLDLEFEDDTPASKLREVILDSKSNTADFEHFGNMYLLEQEWIEKQRIKEEEHRKAMQELSEEEERFKREC